MAALAAALTAPDFRDVIARLVGSLPDHPELMSIYWRNYLEPRRRAMTRLLERARDEGAIRADADIEILLDLIAGAVMLVLTLWLSRRRASRRWYLEACRLFLNTTRAAGSDHFLLAVVGGAAMERPHFPLSGL